MLPDEHLILSAKGGDTHAAETLFRRYQDRIYGFLLRMTGDPDLAADATQETFIRGFRGLERYREQNVFKSWLFRIARNEGVRIIQRHGRQPYSGGGDAMPDMMQDDRPGPHETFEKRKMQQELNNALDALTEEERQVVHLRLREDMTFREIAEIMGCPLNTAVGRMHTAKKKLTRLMAGRTQ